jgi:hypothetical protein
MHKLIQSFLLYNKQYKKNFLFVYTNLLGDFIDENMVVHDKRELSPARKDLRPSIRKAYLN